MNIKQRVQLALLFLMAFSISVDSYSQTTPFEVSLEAIEVPELGGIQSYAFGQANGKWLIIGGRLDGLHRRQPWASFDIAGHNNQLIVVDPTTEQKWSAPLSSLPTTIQEQLSSTNMEFYQEEDYLYCIGGYGYSPTLGDHTTFDQLTAIKVSDVINAIINETAFTNYFRQITNSNFQVTGGRLKKINNTYYLLGGQKFIGRYNPMGPDHGPGFIQEYTNAIRKFNLSDNGTTIDITFLTPHIDETNLHRRDYNAESQILPDGTEGITMFSGVFQHEVDLPFLNSVTVDSDGYEVNNSFQQHYNHYHCPSLPVYSELNNEMHTIFFGGIAQFYDHEGTLVQDNNVPFVNTIARVTRDINGNMTEYKLPIEMPSLLGAGAEFIPNLNLPRYENDVFKLDAITSDSILIGHIFGGISSPQQNIFFINDGTQSQANNQIFRVYIKKAILNSTDELMLSKINTLRLNIYPNPNDGVLTIKFNLNKVEPVTLYIYDAKGSIVDKMIYTDINISKNHYEKNISHLTPGGVYYITLESKTEKMTRKLMMAK